MKIINKNVTIVVIILVFVVIAGYMVWVKSKYERDIAPAAGVEVQEELTGSSESASLASDSAGLSSGSGSESAQSSSSAKSAK